MEEAATKLSAEAGGCVFRDGYGDKLSLRGALGVILDQGIRCWATGSSGGGIFRVSKSKCHSVRILCSK